MISYIIVSYNTSEFTQNTVETIIKSCSDCEIIVVDNNSSDNTVNDIQNRFAEFIDSKLFVIACGENNGFSKGNNIGAERARGDYFVFINPDTVVVSDIGAQLKKIAETKYKNKKVILSPQILNPDYTEQHCMNSFPFAGLKLFFKKAIKQINLKSNKKYIKSDWVTGVCLAMTKEVYGQLNGWNEEFDLYSEDLDICYRLKKNLRGQAVVCRQLKLVHYGNQSGKKVYVTNYASYKKKSDSLKKFFLLHSTEKRFIKWLKFCKRYNNSEELERYYGELTGKIKNEDSKI